MVELVPLKEEEENQNPFSLPFEDSEKAVGCLEGKKRALTRTPPRWHPDFRLAGSETVGK